MLYYSVRDIGVINDLNKFLSSRKPSRQSLEALKNQFPDILHVQPNPDEPESAEITEETSFPHSIVVFIGHAGCGKSTILKHIANRDRTMFYAPTNAAGINLQNILYPSMLLSSNKKCVYRTIHSFYHIQPHQSKRLGEWVWKAMRSKRSIVSYNECLQTMYSGCEPFCAELFENELREGKITPEAYMEYKNKLGNEHNVNGNTHVDVIRYLYSIGLEKKIPHILLYDMCVGEESGRVPDYFNYLFLFYFYYVHVKYNTGIWNHVIPTLMMVGSITQSNNIDEFSLYSSLTFLSQPFMKQVIEEQRMIKITSFKDNRRLTNGDIDKNTTLATVLSKLESGMPINGQLRDKFNETFVTDQQNFYDPTFKPSYFRIAKRHEDLKLYKKNVFKNNKHNLKHVTEFFYCPIVTRSFASLEKYINVKLRSENYDEEWLNIYKNTRLFDQEFNTYKSTRTLLTGFRYLLTEYHKLYIQAFAGTISQFLHITDMLQLYMTTTNASLKCIDFFIDCGKYLVDNVYFDKAEELIEKFTYVQSQGSNENEEASISKLLSLKALLQAKTNQTKIFVFSNEQSGTYLTLPKDIFSFIVSDVETKTFGKDANCSIVHLIYEDCLMFKLYPKLKSINTTEISECGYSEAKHKKTSYKRKREELEDDAYQEDDSVCIEDDQRMSSLLSDSANKSFFKFVPLVLHICSTIDCTQGLTIRMPIIVLIRREDGATERNVSLSRTNNPDWLLVANKIFDMPYEPISGEIKAFNRQINMLQRKNGYL